MMGFENQTAIDTMMPLRVIAYDGEGYKAQLVGNIKKKYPVVTIYARKPLRAFRFRSANLRFALPQVS